MAESSSSFVQSSSSKIVFDKFCKQWQMGLPHFDRKGSPILWMSLTDTCWSCNWFSPFASVESFKEMKNCFNRTSVLQSFDQLSMLRYVPQKIKKQISPRHVTFKNNVLLHRLLCNSILPIVELHQTIWQRATVFEKWLHTFIRFTVDLTNRSLKACWLTSLARKCIWQ